MPEDCAETKCHPKNCADSKITEKITQLYKLVQVYFTIVWSDNLADFYLQKNQILSILLSPISVDSLIAMRTKVKHIQKSDLMTFQCNVH